MCSFTFGGSQSDLAPKHSGTLDSFHPVLAALVDSLGRGERVLGIENPSLAELLRAISHSLSSPYGDSSARETGRSLDSFIEAQVHGAVELGADVQWLIADTAFRGTRTGSELEQLCSRFDMTLGWYGGFMLPVDRIPADFRGPAMPPLASRIAADGILDVTKIGAAAISLRRAPDLWKDWGTPEDTLQQLKQLWHVLVQY